MRLGFAFRRRTDAALGRRFCRDTPRCAPNYWFELGVPLPAAESARTSRISGGLGETGHVPSHTTWSQTGAPERTDRRAERLAQPGQVAPHLRPRLGMMIRSPATPDHSKCAPWRCSALLAWGIDASLGLRLRLWYVVSRYRGWSVRGVCSVGASRLMSPAVQLGFADLRADIACTCSGGWLIRRASTCIPHFLDRTHLLTSLSCVYFYWAKGRHRCSERLYFFFNLSRRTTPARLYHTNVL